MIRIVDNEDERYPDCVLIECVDDLSGEILWRSWAPEDVDPAIRLNPDSYPVVDDVRTTTETETIHYRVPTVAEFTGLAGSYQEDAHRVIATYAAVVEAVTVSEAAKAAQVDEQVLVDEAQGWSGW